MAKKNYIDLTNLSREDWKELRRLGLGGSDVGAILGKSEFKTPMDVYLSKVRPSEDDDDDNMNLWLGHELEDLINKRFELDTGMKVHQSRRMFLHPEHDYFRANVDGIILKKNSGRPGRGIMECKTTTSFMIKDLDTVVLPSYYLQLQFYMYVTGLKWGVISVFIMDKKQIEHHFFDYDPELMEDVLPKLHEFWKRVQDKQPPDIVKPNHDASQLYKHADHGTQKEVDIAVYQDVRQLFEIRAKKNELAEKEDVVLGRIKMAMGPAEELRIVKEKLATWKNQTSRRFDTKKFKKDHPELADEYVKKIETRVFRPTDIDEQFVMAKLDEMFSSIPEI